MTTSIEDKQLRTTKTSKNDQNLPHMFRVSIDINLMTMHKFDIKNAT